VYTYSFLSVYVCIWPAEMRTSTLAYPPPTCPHVSALGRPPSLRTSFMDDPVTTFCRLYFSHLPQQPLSNSSLNIGRQLQSSCTVSLDRYLAFSAHDDTTLYLDSFGIAQMLYIVSVKTLEPHHASVNYKLLNISILFGLSWKIHYVMPIVFLFDVHPLNTSSLQ
jgi:hypothetical protein